MRLEFATAHSGWYEDSKILTRIWAAVTALMIICSAWCDVMVTSLSADVHATLTQANTEKNVACVSGRKGSRIPHN